jgi:GNAT superfamily N-acetyltransferase
MASILDKVELMSPEQSHKPTIEVTPATAKDLRPLVDIEEAVSMQKYPNAELGVTSEDIAAIGWGDERVAKYRGRFLENPNANIWIATEDKRIVGFTVAVKNEDGHRIWKLYIADDQQSKGIGGKLLAQAEEWLGDAEPIWLGVAAFDHAALDFYSNHGYEHVGLRPEEQTIVHATGKVIREALLVKHPVQQ